MLFLLVTSIVFAAACTTQPQQVATIAGATMGTTYSVKVALPGPLSGRRLATLKANLEARLDDVDRKMSTYNPESELSLLNRFVAGEPYAISANLLEVLEAAEDLYISSLGAFDPTVGPLVDLWGFGPTIRLPKVPPQQQLQEVMAQVGWSHVRLDRQASTVLKTRASLSIDLSAIAKGYAVDQLSEHLAAEGYEHFLVEVGGELRVSGFRDKQTGTHWRVGVETPTQSLVPVRPHRILELESGALATSGDYRNGYTVDGVRYSHTIDPATGHPVPHQGVSVTVFAETCMSADALATALLVMGPEKGTSWAEQRGVAALFLVYNSDGSLSERRTLAMQTLLVDSSSN